MKTVFIGVHPDDVELGAGAMIMLNPGSDCLVLSHCVERPRNKFILEELAESVKLMDANLTLADFPVMHFPGRRDEIRQYLYDFIHVLEPDTIFMPSIHDIHEDHQLVAEEVIRVAREPNIFSYEIQRSCRGFQPNVFVPFTEAIMDLKLSLIDCYKSQVDLPYFSHDAIRSLGLIRGLQASVKDKLYAEAFECVRLVSNVGRVNEC